MSPDRLVPALEESWFIPHDELGLLTLYNTPEGMIKNEEDTEIKRLMDKYFGELNRE